MPIKIHRVLQALIVGGTLIGLSACGGSTFSVKPFQSAQQSGNENIAGNGSGSNHATHEYMLANGMKLIVKEDHRAPVVVSQIWYKVGASYEHIGITGVSHVLEHMMFKGTDKHPPGEFSRIIAENGGRENAFTGRDYTSYFQQLEVSRLPIAFELEADRMRNLHLQEEEFQKERDVVIEERRMRTEDKPSALTYEKFMATAFQVNPYHNPVIGWMDDLKSLTLDDLSQWYRTWYSPNNATLVVVGDVNAEEVVDLAKQTYGQVEPGQVPELKSRDEVEQRGERRMVVETPAQVPYLLIGYKVPSLNKDVPEWQPYALEVLANILDGGQSARFARNLVRGSQVAASAGAGYDLYTPRQELFIMDGTPAQGHSVEELEKAIYAQLDELKQNLVDDQELSRVKAQVVADKVYERDSLFYQAMQIGKLETTGFGWEVQNEFVDRIEAVTAEQVREVARQYFDPQRRTVARLDPQPINGNNPRPMMHSGGGNVR